MSDSSTQVLASAATAARRAVSAHRRLLAAGLAAGAVAFALDVLAPHPPATVPVVVAAGDLEGGRPLAREDIEIRRLPSDAVPTGTIRDRTAVVGRVLTAPVRAGEPLTDVRVVGPGLVEGYGRGMVAVPVRIADAESVGLVRVGDRIDVLAPDPRGVRGAGVVVSSAPVVAVPARDPDLASGTSGALVVLAVTAEQATSLSQAMIRGPLSVALRG
ncbi:MAG: Flp pilus assembly protein CpaB [Propionibacteriales bacterium]|nr:Flp pilus assembly protein CpaB [Propionibacteriales bacterium]